MALGGIGGDAARRVAGAGIHLRMINDARRSGKDPQPAAAPPPPFRPTDRAMAAQPPEGDA
jgi:hypothetical protein